MADNKFIKPLIIGSVKCPNNTVLAPMVGVGDLPFRKLCAEGGAGLVCAEMVSSMALAHRSKKTEKMLATGGEKCPVSIQVFGADAPAMAFAAKQAERFGADIVDINSGCPANKVIKNKAGAKLMEDEKNFAEIVRACVKAVKVPVTVKMRIGTKRGKLLSPAICKIAEEEGASAVAVHARYAVDFHNGEPNMDALYETRKAVKNIPFIANGGINNPETAKKMFSAGADSIMIGQAAIGFPTIFRAVANALDGGEFVVPTHTENIKTFLKLIEEDIKLFGERPAILRSRMNVICWIRDFPMSAKARDQYMKLETFAEVKTLLESVQQ